MTAIIDRALAGGSFCPEYLGKEHITSYLEALEACGTDYIEIGADLVPLLGEEDLSQRYILHIEREEDIACCGRKFAYVSVPFALGHLIGRIGETQNVIAEITADEYSVHAELLRLRSSGLLKYISVVRVTGCFSMFTEKMEELVSWFRENFVQSIDICPLNTGLCGCVGAIGAADAGADAVTLSFGSDKFYTSLESYYIEKHILSQSFMPKEIIEGICRASQSYVDIFCDLPCGLMQADELTSRLRTPVCNPELGIVYRTFAVRAKPEQPPKESAVQKEIESLDLESELEKAVKEAVKKANIIN